ncbi:MAG: T9SS type A sorting domain-containing protein, partial [Saprospiraceae bacterium]|nr:T9SS type A sorting domain-containing protein [Saprospiraceae bacterium]
FEPYGKRSINLHLLHDPSYNDGGVPKTAAGYASGSNRVVMFNVGYYPDDPLLLDWNFKVFNHEVGHCLGLGHAYLCGNECVVVPGDLAPVLECDIEEQVCQEIDNGFGVPLICDWGNSNNLMSSGPGCLALSPCQWSEAYGNLYNHSRSYTDIGCDHLSASPIFINQGEDVVWERGKLLFNDVRVKTGGKLTIKCAAYFKTGYGIVVEKGGKLIVDGGLLSNLCPDTRWRGIDVHGNPNIPQPDPNGMPLADQAGIVQLLNGAAIEFAEIGVFAGHRAVLPPSQVAPNLNGGLVVGDGAKFMNNQVAIHLPAYRKGNAFQNKSNFYNCRFEQNPKGLLISHTDGVKVELSSFIGNNQSGTGMQIFDADVRVINHCSFDDLKFGIEAYSSFNYGSSLEISGGNNFKTNYVGALIRNSDKDAGLIFVGNTAVSNTVGLAVESGTVFDITDNVFSFNEKAAVDIRNTSALSTESRFLLCNNINWFNCLGVHALGANDQIKIDGNHFFGASAGSIDVLLKGAEGNPGSFGPDVSNSEGLLPVRNCFSAWGRHNVTEGATVHFIYPYKDGDTGCYIPLCDDDDIGCVQNNNYHNRSIVGEPAENCDNQSPPRAFEPITPDNLYTQPSGKILGYYFRQGDQTGAWNALNQLPVSTPSDLTFKQVQTINFDRIFQPGFSLSPGQQVMLEQTVQSGDLLNAPFAEAILIAEKQIPPGWQPPVCPGERPQAEGRGQYAAAIGSSRIILKPNPASTIVRVEFADAESNREISLFGSNGIRYFYQTLTGAAVEIPVEQLPNGVYFLRVNTPGKAVIHEKLIIQH